MTVHFETIRRSTVALAGALIATMMLVIASAPYVPVA